MKIFFFIFISLIAFRVAATTRERDVYDLQFLPEKKVVFGLSDFSYGKNQIRTQSSSFKSENAGFAQTIGTSLTDNFSMSIGGFYNHVRNESTFNNTFGNGSSRSTQQGVGDPTLNLKYRLQDNYFRFDLLAAYRFKTGDSDFKSMKTGTNALDFGFNFGQKYELVQWSVLMNYHREMENGSIPAYNYYSLEASGLWNFGDYNLIKVFARAGISDITGSYNRSTVTNVRLGPEYQHLLTENFLIRAGVSFTTSEVTSRDDKINEGWIYNLGATYQF